MRHLERLIRKSKYRSVLPEWIRDQFSMEVERLRRRAESACKIIGNTASQDTNEGRIARQLEQAILRCLNDSAARRFDEALRAIRVSKESVDLLEDIGDSHRKIESATREYEDLHSMLGFLPFRSVDDLKLIITRANVFYSEHQYRTAAFLATICSQEIRKALTPSVADAEPFASRILHQLALADELKSLPFGACDATRIRDAAHVIASTTRGQYFDLAVSLLHDVEAENAPIESFLWLYRMQQPTLSFEGAIFGRADNFDWRAATTRIVAYSLAESSRCLSQKTLVAASGA